MQVMRRLSTVIIWVFALFYILSNYRNWTYGSIAYIESRGGRAGGGSEEIFAWIFIGIVIVLAFVAQLITMWIFVDKNKSD